MCYCPTPTLHLNLALTGDGAFQLSPQKTHSVWFISILNYGDTENVLINHLLLVIPMSYPCHYTNLCPHKPHKHAHTHTHTHSGLSFHVLNSVINHVLFSFNAKNILQHSVFDYECFLFYFPLGAILLLTFIVCSSICPLILSLFMHFRFVKVNKHFTVKRCHDILF